MIPAAASHMALGLVLGLRHAFEADHIAAVAAISSRERTRRLALGVSLGSVVFGLLYGATTLAAAIARHPLS